MQDNMPAEGKISQNPYLKNKRYPPRLATNCRACKVQIPHEKSTVLGCHLVAEL